MGKVCLKSFILLVLFCVVSSCSTFSKNRFIQEGTASWYGEKFNGRKTASGEIFNMNAMTAAHPTLPFGTKLIVRSKKSGRTVTVRVNDRGPYASNRIIDLSFAAARELGFINRGEEEVEISTP